MSIASSQEHEEPLLKILVIGESGVGKTAIIRRYVHNQFSQGYKTTIGVDFALKVVGASEVHSLVECASANPTPSHIHMPKPSSTPPPLRPSSIRLQLWDIAGQDRFHTLARNYYREASGAIIVFDQTLPRSFAKILDWKNDLVTRGGQLPIIIMQNKCDMPMHADIPAHDAMISWAISNEILGCVETSAKDHTHPGIAEAVAILVHKIVTKGHAPAAPAAQGVVQLGAQTQQSKSCC